MQKFERELIRCNARIARLENSVYELSQALVNAHKSLREFIYIFTNKAIEIDDSCFEGLEEYIVTEEGEYLERKTEDDN